MKRVLQFSGGKDSLALLFLMEEEWSDLLVMWCNAGAPHASTLAMMDYVRELVPNFIEVSGDQPAFVREWGYPTDIMPIATTRIGRLVHGTEGDCFVSAHACCMANIWQPMRDACKRLGVTDVYRGQKDSDRRKAPIKDLHVEEGVTYHFPLQHWTDDDVFAFLADRVPEHYKRGEKSSRDCWDCTAYLDENVERIKNLTTMQRTFVQGKLKTLLAVTDKSRADIAACLMGSE